MAEKAEISTTLGELVEVEPVLRRVTELDGMTAKAKYHLAKLARLVGQETKHFYTERAQLFETMGVEREPKSDAERRQFGPKVREIPTEQVSEFQAKVKDLSAVPVTIPWGPLRSIDLTQAKASDLVDLGPLCELVEPPEEAPTK